MKIKFSKHWKASKQPRKQRKYSANAPLHIKRKLLGVNLTKELRKKYGKRNLPVRKGDTVRVMRGKFKNKQGKIISVDIKNLKLKIDTIMIKKRDGSKVNVKVHPSNLQIIELNIEERKRMKTLNKKDSIEKDKQKNEEKGENKK